MSRPSLTPIKAFSTALDIERALLENRYFEVFETDSAELRRTLTMLAQSTQNHLDRVHEAWRANKQAPHSLPS
jgi:hypothetical protein